MKAQVNSMQLIRQRRFFMMLPLLVIPFLTLIFWALGGGKVQRAQGMAKKGFNMDLPNAYLKEDSKLDKMSYYNQAALDSAKRKELIKNDPNHEGDPGPSIDPSLTTNQDSSKELLKSKGLSNTLKYSPYDNSKGFEPNEEKVYRKLSQLNRVINSSPTRKEENSRERIGPYNNKVASNEMMLSPRDEKESVSTGNTDPEMKQLNGMLEKIIDIQHPEKLQMQLKEKSALSRGQVFAVYADKADIVSSIDQSREVKDKMKTDLQAANHFYSLESAGSGSNLQNVIEAMVPQSQTLVSGATVKLCLSNDILINGQTLPAGTYVFGTGVMNGERLSIRITNIRLNNALFPVDLNVYDLDGLEGIYIPGTISRDVAKQSVDRSLQTSAITNLDPSIGAQAASAGIETAKSLLSKKVKLIKVTLKAGYHVLLKDEKQKEYL